MYMYQGHSWQVSTMQPWRSVQLEVLSMVHECPDLLWSCDQMLSSQVSIDRVRLRSKFSGKCLGMCVVISGDKNHRKKFNLFSLWTCTTETSSTDLQ